MVCGVEDRGWAWRKRGIDCGVEGRGWEWRKRDGGRKRGFEWRIRGVRSTSLVSSSATYFIEAANK